MLSIMFSHIFHTFAMHRTILQRENAVESHANVQEPEGTEELSDFQGLRYQMIF